MSFGLSFTTLVKQYVGIVYIDLPENRQEKHIFSKIVQNDNYNDIILRQP